VLPSPSPLPHALHLALWQRAWAGVGAQGDGLALLQALQTRYCEPHRRYHSQQHLAECLNTFEAVAHLAQRPHEVALALWFHDAIYDVHPVAGAPSNEAQSAHWAATALHLAGVPAPSVARVESLVMATCHTAQPTKPTTADEALLVDIDLSILGAAPERFVQYEQQIRAEYAHVPDAVFHPKRRDILTHFFTKPRIYVTPYFYQAHEAVARKNLYAVLQASQ
jgi:predicted metal-dependent HD superfamily phosphohydrolase